MSAPVESAKLLYSESRDRTSVSPVFSQAVLSGLAFFLLCVLIALGATRSVDWWGQQTLTGVSFTLLDVTSFVLTLLGVAPITGALAVTLAIRGWYRS